MQANANQQAVIDKYGFELKDDPKDWIIVDPVVRRANRGKGGRYVSGNLDECLARAVADRKEAEKSMRAPSDKTERKNARAKTNPEKPKPVEETPPEEVNPSEQEPIQIESHVEPVRLGELNETPEYTSAQEAVLFNYGLSISRDGGNFRIIDLEVQQYYAFRDASKKGRYEGSDLDELLKTAAEIHDGMVAEKEAKKNKKTRSTKSKEPEVKEEKEKKPRGDNRYLRASRIIVKQPTITAVELAKQAVMSEATANHCLDAWRGVTAALIENGDLKK